MLAAILWDVDGTLAETERDGHLKAFNRAFEISGVPWRWSELRYGELLKVAGGRERLLPDMQFQSHAPDSVPERQVLAERVHDLKNKLYAEIVSRGGLALRPGVRELLEDCARAGTRMGIVTTTSRSNIEALLEADLGMGWESRFSAVICAREAPLKKPHPQAYLLALETLQLRAHQVVAMEDAPAGVAAALAAGVPVILTRSHFFPDADSPDVLAAGPSLGRTDGWHPAADARANRIDLEQIVRFHAQTIARPL
jgi:HAD superfamily hydrolase (TIGR01509 family)